MIRGKSCSEIYFSITVITVLMFSTIACLIPIIHIIAISFSSREAAEAGKVFFIPVDFTLKAYKYLMMDKEYWNSFLVSVFRIFIGLPLELVLTVLTAYPLSLEVKKFYGRTYYVWFFVFSMLFSGGLISTYIVIKQIGLIDKFFVLLLPRAVNVFNIIMMLNFFRAVPFELKEAAQIDGAGHMSVLFKIMIPLSLPSIAAVSVYITAEHWNSWFDGMIYINNYKLYPLQTYLKTLVIDDSSNIMAEKDMAEYIKLVSNKTLKAAQVIIAMMPVLVIYPMLQKHFEAGITLGSLKE